MLKSVRWLHRGISISAGTMLCVVGLTGFLLNRKDWIEHKWRRRWKREREQGRNGA